MNKRMLQIVCSPETHIALLCENNALHTIDGKEIYSVVEDTPIVMHHQQVAAVDMGECCEILKMVIPEDIYQQLQKDWIQTHDNEAYSQRLQSYIKEHLGKDGIMLAYKKYADLPSIEKNNWLPNEYLSEGEHSLQDLYGQIPMYTYNSYQQYSKEKNGELRMMTADKILKTWAVHLKDYGYAVNKVQNSVIVELGTGAGLGTCGVLSNGFTSNHLVTIDIDYACLGNAIGLAKYLHLEKQIDTVCANFWSIPIRTSSVDVVCSHYGLDEARRIPQIISEVSRILKPHGRFILISRTDHLSRLRSAFNNYEFSEEEYEQLNEEAEHNPGVNAIQRISMENGLILEEKTLFSPEHSHERVLLVFNKQP